MEKGKIPYKNTATNKYSLFWKRSKIYVMQESFKTFKQPKQKAKKFQQNNSINPSQRTNIT